MNDDTETSSAHWLLSEHNCDIQMVDNPGTAQSEISFDYDSTSVEFNVTAALTSFTSWADHFQSSGCYDIQSCWLSTEDGSTNLTEPVYMGSAIW